MPDDARFGKNSKKELPIYTVSRLKMMNVKVLNLITYNGH